MPARPPPQTEQNPPTGLPSHGRSRDVAECGPLIAGSDEAQTLVGEEDAHHYHPSDEPGGRDPADHVRRSFGTGRLWDRPMAWGSRCHSAAPFKRSVIEKARDGTRVR